MSEKKKDAILVPIDFTDVSEFAIDHAIEIAKISKRKIYLLHVVSKRTTSAKLMLMQEKLEDQVTAVAKRTRLKVSYLLVEGNIFNTISDIAGQVNAEFIVMGIHGKKGVQHIVGGYAYKVVKSSKVPVLLVKHMHHHVGYKNIVLPVNFSRKRFHKIAEAKRFARYFGATIRIFGFQSTHNKAKILNKEALLNSVRELFNKENIPVTTDLWINPGYDWAEAMMKYADKIDADLIMMVADKPSRIQDMFSSNATERIIDKADVPILAVPTIDKFDHEEMQKKAILKAFIDPLGLLSDTNP